MKPEFLSGQRSQCYEPDTHDLLCSDDPTTGYQKGNEKGNEIVSIFQIFPVTELHMEQVGECNQGDQYNKHQVADSTCHVA